MSIRFEVSILMSIGQDTTPSLILGGYDSSWFDPAQYISNDIDDQGGFDNVLVQSITISKSPNASNGTRL